MAKFLDENGLLYVWGKIKKLLSDGFVAKVAGKGLSANDYTNEDKEKLAGLKTNVQADWDATSGDAAILNKPSIPKKTSELNNDSGFITTSDIPEGAAATTTQPLMDGDGKVGTEKAFARGDHQHPHDTSKQDVIEDLDDIRSGASKGATAYQKPSTGIPSTDMAQAVQTSLGKADTAYQKPSTGIPSSDMAQAVKTSLGKADTAYQKPTAGIPESDLSDEVQSSLGDVSGKADKSEMSVTTSGDKTTVTLKSGTSATVINKHQSLDGCVKVEDKGVAGGWCPLDANKKVDAQYLPSYVDDVVEVYPRASVSPLSKDWFSETSGGSAITPEKGKIYTLMASGGDGYPENSQYRWGGTTFVKLNDGNVSPIANTEIDDICK